MHVVFIAYFKTLLKSNQFNDQGKGYIMDSGLCCLVHPGVRDKRRVSEIDLSQYWFR